MSVSTYEVYGTARFFIEEGLYTIKEVEQILADMKAACEAQNKALRKSMEQMK
jgi:hypothetical protein